MREPISTQKKQWEKSQILDLTIGNPVYMREYWLSVAKSFSNTLGNLSIGPADLLDYDYDQSNQELKKAIKYLHNWVGNADCDNCEVVFGCGASQLVSAAVYALKAKGCDDFIVEPPHWGRLPKLIAYGLQAGTKDNKTPIDPNLKTRLVVLPNNPDFSVNDFSSESSQKIYDLCYYWPQYLDKESVIKRSDDIMIFGLSKATGHAGTRFGWALVKDPQTANLMKKYIELTTSGVSAEAQARALVIINSIEDLYNAGFTNCFEFANREMISRWTMFKDLCSNFGIFPVNKSGMFAWCKTHPDISLNTIEDLLGIKCLPGETFGASNEYFRLNLGCDSEVFNELINRMQELSAVYNGT